LLHRFTMSKLSFDYSKWDRLELSDDEETHHPNLDKNLNIRVQRITRDRKEDEIDTKQAELKKEGKEEEAAALEKKRPLHDKNMSQVVDERTIIQSYDGERIDKFVKDREEFSIDDYSQFKQDHKRLLEEFTHADWEKSHTMLNDHGGILLNQHANTYFLLTTLDEEMKGDKKLVKKLGKQGQIISQIFQLAEPMKRHPRDLVHRFFDKFDTAGGQEAFQQGVDHFLGHIERRAIEKKKEEEAEAAKAQEEAAAQQGEAVPLVEAMYDMKVEDRKGPGGLDPVEVFESLPQALQECFKSGDVERLKEEASKMDPKEFEAHFKRCIDAGLWSGGGS